MSNNVVLLLFIYYIIFSLKSLMDITKPTNLEVEEITTGASMSTFERLPFCAVEVR